MSIVQKAVSDSVINTGDEEIAIGASGVAGGRSKEETGVREVGIGDHVKQGFVHEEPPRLLSIDQAFERIGTEVRSNLSNLELYIKQASMESSDFFKLALIFAFLGFIILLFGVGLYISDLVEEGIIAIVNAFVSVITAAFFLHKDKERRVTMEQYRQTVMDSQYLLGKIDVADLVKEKRAREILKKEIIRNALGVEQSSQQSSAPAKVKMVGRMHWE